jgi:hypothetical protein
MKEILDCFKKPYLIDEILCALYLCRAGARTANSEAPAGDVIYMDQRFDQVCCNFVIIVLVAVPNWH